MGITFKCNTCGNLHGARVETCGMCGSRDVQQLFEERPDTLPPVAPLGFNPKEIGEKVIDRIGEKLDAVAESLVDFLEQGTRFFHHGAEWFRSNTDTVRDPVDPLRGPKWPEGPKVEGQPGSKP